MMPPQPPAPDLIDRVAHLIKREDLLPNRASVVVAVSGGADSMVLLHILHALSGPRKWSLVVAHFNHLLRGRESDRDEAFVKKMARQLGCPFRSGRFDVQKWAQKNGWSLEMAARDRRHRFLADVCRRQKTPWLALGHHLDDRLELFFLRLLRGSGIEGLTGLKLRGSSFVAPEITLIRPLLNETRSNVEAFARERSIAFRTDQTNQETQLQRNQVRHDWIPLLDKIQPRWRITVQRSLTLLETEHSLLVEQAHKWLAQTRPSIPFKDLPMPLRRLVIYQQLKVAVEGVNFELVDQLLAEDGRPISVGPSQTARQKDGRVLIRTARQYLQSKEEMELTFRGSSQQFNFGGIKFSIRRLPGKTLPASRSGCEWLDADQVGAFIVFRHWRRGDRFQPLGNPGHSKLQDLFTDLKVPAPERQGRVVATTRQGEIFWVEGLRPGERFKLDKNTRQRLKWCWKRSEGKVAGPSATC